MKSPRTWRGARWRPVFQGRYEISLSDVIRDVSRIKCCSVVLLVGGKKKKKRASRSSRCRAHAGLMRGLKG